MRPAGYIAQWLERLTADQQVPGDVEMDFVGSVELEDHLGKLEPHIDDFVSSLLLNQMGDRKSVV